MTEILNVFFNLLTLFQRFRKLIVASPDLKMRGKIRAGSYVATANDYDAKLKGDGNISAITEKETHF